MSAKDLVDRVQKACGKLAREVKVEGGKDGTVSVHVFAMPATEHLLVTRLLQVPELSASNVSLNVHMAK
jgi:hypothetical protein